MPLGAALMYARISSSTGTGTGLYKKARIGATRLGYFGPKQILTVNGTLRTNQFDKLTWSVTDRSRGQGKTLSIHVFGFTPAVGQEIVLGAGSISNRLFRGTITRVRQVRHRLTEGRVVYACQCVDWTYQASNNLVTKRYANLSASTIAIDLITTFAPAGFGSTFVQGGLATVDEIQFTVKTLPAALQQLCDHIGGAFYFDADKTLHLYVGTDTTGVKPEDITAANLHVHDGFGYTADIEALRNRIWVEGQGASVTAAVTAGFTSIPVTDVQMFASSATNYAKLEAHPNLTYTGKSTLQAQGALVAGIPQGPTAPSAAVSAGVSGDVLGVVSYKVIHRSAAGDSEPSSASGTATATAVTAPGSAPTVTVSTTVDGGMTPGARKHMVTFVTSKGETLAGTRTGNTTITEVPQPSTGGMTVTPGAGGSVPVSSTYYLGVSYITAAGETQVTFWGTVATGAAQNRLSWASIPTSSDGRVTGRRLYRSPSVNGDIATMKLVTTLNDNTTTSYTDDAADASLGAFGPAVNTTGGRYALTAIPTSADGRVTKRRVYRTAAGGSIYKLLTTIADNSTTTFTDSTPDTSLGQTEPETDTSGGGVVAVTVPVGPAGTTARKIYRTVGGGSAYKYLGQIPDNVTTAYSDTRADANLGEDAPAGSTVRTEAGSTTLRVTDLSKFPAAGWARVGSLVIVYTGRSGASGEGTLTGVPATGVGAITAPVAAGSAAVVEPHLTGIPASGTGAIQHTLAVGAQITLLVKGDDATSQATYGVRELHVQDRRLSLAGAANRAAAELAIRKDARVSGGGPTSDPKMAAGRPLTINHATWGLTASVTVTSVTITPRKDRPQPMADIEFATRNTDDLFTQLREIRDQLNR